MVPIKGITGCKTGICCELEPCAEFDYGECKPTCDLTLGEKAHYNCTIGTGQCCWASEEEAEATAEAES